MKKRFAPLDTFDQILDQSTQCIEYLKNDLSLQELENLQNYRDLTNSNNRSILHFKTNLRDVKGNARESVKNIEVSPKYYKLDSLL